MELTRAIISVAFVAVLLVLQSIPAQSKEAEDEEYSYKMGSKNGPDRWSSLNKEWVACNNGRMQSPIDLSVERVEVLHQLGELKRSYRPAPAIMENRGHDIMLQFVNGSGGLWINGTEYILNQLHWHSPSEHTIDGQRFALELHMVHESADKKIAVVGILYKIGRPDPFLAEMEDSIRAIKDIENGKEDVGVVDPRQVRRGSRKYFRYIGSLTTPPCTEGVVWTIVSKVRTVSREQVRLLRDAVHDKMENNARPSQPTNGRIIRYFRPWGTGY